MTATNTQTGSQVVAALENVWSAIQSRHPEVPDVVIVTGTGSTPNSLVWGHFGENRWIIRRTDEDVIEGAEVTRTHELKVSGETFDVGPVKIVQTMLHEATHAIAAVRGVKDTSRQNRYHNRKFVEIANELGLEYPHPGPHATIGFSAVEITEETRADYSDEIDELEAAIALAIKVPGVFGESGQGDGGDGAHGPRRPRNPQTTKGRSLKASCDCGRSFRIARSVLEEAGIVCLRCSKLFTLNDGS
ncbi:hypothetical protein [Jiangella rhizosphaerae]|uniref:SprT-like domain-containing protein n=1 Tax=Jiangella rhizosphaerae TaxID=2293569 RepID=A0A418KHE3_9ACTN|nr:hypothetical protein [Jiangella rhizosphaerae]RIQ11422.1 hypothetical protein DY240_28750 [Jiangella rhizosphaerae]